MIVCLPATTVSQTVVLVHYRLDAPPTTLSIRISSSALFVFHGRHFTPSQWPPHLPPVSTPPYLASLLRPHAHHVHGVGHMECCGGDAGGEYVGGSVVAAAMGAERDGWGEWE
jgi:hypothetical protein